MGQTLLSSRPQLPRFGWLFFPRARTKLVGCRLGYSPGTPYPEGQPPSAVRSTHTWQSPGRRGWAHTCPGPRLCHCPAPRDRAVSMACDGPSCVTPDASTTSLNTLHGGALKEPSEHTMAPSLSAQKLPRAVQSLPCPFSGLVWHLGGLQRQESRNNLGGRSGSLPGWLFVQRRAEVQGCPPS